MGVPHRFRQIERVPGRNCFAMNNLQLRIDLTECLVENRHIEKYHGFATLFEPRRGSRVKSSR